MATGLLLGAGASFENGMPLVWDLTTELKKWLTPEKLREFNVGWALQGNGLPPEVIETVISDLANPNMHYESILGNIEVQIRRHPKLLQNYNTIYGWLIDMICHMLYFRHSRNVNYIDDGLLFLKGIVGLTEQNKPLWIFSLNHDLMIECLTSKYGVKLNTGFPGKMTIPRRDKSGNVIEHMDFDSISSEEFQKSGLKFPVADGAEGINLLKIHGSLDSFAVNDGKELIKLSPTTEGTARVIDLLTGVHLEAFYPEPRWENGRVNVIGEIAYADNDGEMQFLRRSILSGAFKFERRGPETQTLDFLKQFKSHLNRLDKLICIGYGLGDHHINVVLRGWLETSEHRRLEIVGPGASIPANLNHLAPQIETVSKTATEYLEQFAPPLSAIERGFRTARNAMRERARKNQGFC